MATESLLGVVTIATVNSLTTHAIDQSFKDTGLHRFGAMVKGLAAENKILGIKRCRDLYLKSPLIKAIADVDEIPGSIHVAVVPPGEGKTIATNAFFHCSPPSKGIAVCPTGSSLLSYHEKLASELKIDSSKRGWMYVFLKSLHDVGTEKGRPCVLILDEFLAGVSETDTITDAMQQDLDFVFNIKSIISEWQISVIVLTPNVFAAGLALGKNNLSGIMPLPGLFSGNAIIETRNGLRFGRADWNTSLWTEDLLIDLVVLHHGAFFDRTTISSWFQGDPQLKTPKRLLTHAHKISVAKSRPNRYNLMPCTIKSVPADLSCPIMVPPSKVPNLWMGCIPPLF